MMKILILGHKGMLGYDLLWRFSARHEVTGRDIDEVDIASAEACREVIRETAPQVVINAAAYTDVDGCETNREACHAANAEGVRNLALACRERDVRMVHFSTDYVFDGMGREPYREADRPSPQNEYGRSKLTGEAHLQELVPDHLLIRTAWLYGLHGRNFVKAILDKAKVVDTLEVVDDQLGSPTFTEDLAAAVQYLVEEGHRGIYHVTNRGSCTWFEFANRIIQYKGIQGVKVLPITTERLNRPAKRPLYSVLSCRKFIEGTGRTMRFWQIALQDYLSRINP